MTNTSHDESLHPRAKTGKWEQKGQNAPEASVNLEAWEPGEDVDADSLVREELEAYRASGNVSPAEKLTLQAIDEELEALATSATERPDREFELGAAGARLLVLDRFPSATELEVWNPVADDGEISISPKAIRDENGDVLWEERDLMMEDDSESDTDSDFQELLTEYTTLLDRRGGLNALFQKDIEEGAREWVGLKLA